MARNSQNRKKNLNEKVQDAIKASNKIVEKHAPMKQATQTKQKQFNKPWLTKGILKSIKRKQIKYLGVFIDEHLKWDAQLQHINNKLTKTIGILYKLRHYVSMSTLKHSSTTPLYILI